MFIQTVDPCRFNYLKKRIETDSEILPLFDDTLLTKTTNVKLLAIHVHEPVVYTFTDCSKIIHKETIKKLETPKKEKQPSEIFDAFFEPNFFDLMISHFENIVMCMSRIDHEKWKLSILLSFFDEQSAEEMIKMPKMLIQKYNFENNKDLKLFDSFTENQKKILFLPE
ncbi:hypothetical protein M153_12549000338, partial [Pseudoloma neurophilia]